MKKIALEKTSLDACVKRSQSGRVLLTRQGNPVALVYGIEGLDEEQVELGSSSKFWKLMEARRKQKTISRTTLEETIRQNKAPAK